MPLIAWRSWKWRRAPPSSSLRIATTHFRLSRPSTSWVVTVQVGDSGALGRMAEGVVALRRISLSSSCEFALLPPHRPHPPR